MSAYSEWKYGLITDAEYNSACREEEERDRYYEAHPEEYYERFGEETEEDAEIDE